MALVATGANAASATTASANGSRAPDFWQKDNQPYWEGAAGTVWLQSGTEKSNVVESWSNDTRYDLGPYVRAYTPIPADDDTAAFRAVAAMRAAEGQKFLFCWNPAMEPAWDYDVGAPDGNHQLVPDGKNEAFHPPRPSRRPPDLPGDSPAPPAIAHRRGGARATAPS